MSTETITLEIDSEAARVFKSASLEQRKKFILFVSYYLKEYGNEEPSALMEIMDDISQKARERGLTPEILKSILQED